jgi:hypothetical protein
MNNPFNLQNDLNGFRASVGNQVAAYDHNVAILNTGVLRKKAEAIRAAKETLDKGAELLRTGLETEGAIVGGKAIGKAGKAIYNKVMGNKTAKAANESKAGDDTEGGSTPEDTGGDLGGGANQSQEIEMTDRSSSNAPSQQTRTIESDDNVSRPTNARPGEGGGEQGEGLEMTDRSQGRIGRPSDGETKTSDDLEETKEGDIGDLGEDLAEDASDAVQAGTEAAEGASSAITGAGDALAGAASGVGDALAGGMAAESSLAEAAAATSWIPFVGEVLGGIAAVGGLVAAGVGVYEDVVGGDQQKKADEMANKIAQNPQIQVAGTYTAPLASSVAV